MFYRGHRYRCGPIVRHHLGQGVVDILLGEDGVGLRVGFGQDGGYRVLHGNLADGRGELLLAGAASF